MKRNFYYISQGLPNSYTGGTALYGINLLRKLKKKFKIKAVSILKSFYQTSSILKAEKELKKEGIKFYKIGSKSKKLVHHKITLLNFFKTNYYDSERIQEIKKFITKVKIKKNDVIFCVGSNAIMGCQNLPATKIALIEDIQDQSQIYRTYLAMNKFNFIKKFIKIFMLKIYFRDYYNWLKKITQNYNLIYTYSPFDFSKLRKKINLSVLSSPMDFKSQRKKKIKKKFNISMFSSSISQDYNGVILFYEKLLPQIKKNNLLKKIKLNLVMSIPKKLPRNIKKIIDDENIHLEKYDNKILNDTDMLFYPSKYPVGVRSKILHGFSRSWIVATSSTIKKCIPELKDNHNCLMSDNIDHLIKKILYYIDNKKKFKHININSRKVLKNYMPDLSAQKILNDLNNFTF